MQQNNYYIKNFFLVRIHMVMWRIDTKSLSKLVGYLCMPGHPSQSYMAIICSLRLKRCTFFYPKKERDATLRWIYCQTKYKPSPYKNLIATLLIFQRAAGGNCPSSTPLASPLIRNTKKYQLNYQTHNNKNYLIYLNIREYSI